MKMGISSPLGPGKQTLPMSALQLEHLVRESTMRPSPVRTIPLVLLFAAACADRPGLTSVPVAGEAALAKAPTNPTLAFHFPLGDASLALRSDGLFASGGSSVYTHGVCGVNTTLFVSGSGDATMQTNNPKFADRRCAAYPRRMTLAYDDGVTETIPVFINLHEIQNASFSIPVGGSALRMFAVNPPQRTRCDRLVWGGVSGNGDHVVVTRTAANSWEVRSQAYPNNQAWCSTTGVLHHMSVSFTIVSG